MSENANAEHNNGIKRLYYSITEVSDLVDEEQYALRYWETEFAQLKPQKNRAGNRVYTEHDIKVIRDIQYLLRIKRLTIDAAKEHLAPLYPERPTPPISAPEMEQTNPTNPTTIAPPAASAEPTASAVQTGEPEIALGTRVAQAESATPLREETGTQGFGFSRAPVAEWNAPFVGQFPHAIAAVAAPLLAREDAAPKESESTTIIEDSSLQSDDAQAATIPTTTQNHTLITREELLDIRAALVEALRLLTPETPVILRNDDDGE